MSLKEQKEIATVMLVLDDNALAADVNHILHDFADFIILIKSAEFTRTP